MSSSDLGQESSPLRGCQVSTLVSGPAATVGTSPGSGAPRGPGGSAIAQDAFCGAEAVRRTDRRTRVRSTSHVVHIPSPAGSREAGRTGAFREGSLELPAFVFLGPKDAADLARGRDQREPKPGGDRLGDALEQKTQRKFNDLGLLLGCCLSRFAPSLRFSFEIRG